MRLVRNPGVELFRVVCMLAICMQHVVLFSKTGSYGFESRFWNFGVVGFAFITGYYGITFSLRKILSLWLTAIFSICMLAFIAHAFEMTSELGGFAYFKYILLSNWYLNSYTVLLCLAPFLNIVVGKILISADSHGRQDVVSAFFILMIWSFFQGLWGVREYVPHVAGMDDKSFMMLVYIYFIGQWVNVKDVLLTFSTMWISIFFCCLFLTPVLGSYTSLVTITFTIILFRLFQRMHVPIFVETIIKFIVPSLFAVYLLHTNSIGFEMIARVVKVMMENGFPRYLAYGITAVGILTVCIGLDISRRIIVAFSHQMRLFK